MHAEPRDLNVLPENESRKDARTLDKLIDGKNEGEEKHSWLAPFTETNAIFVCFDAAVAISRLTLWNYANTCVEINQCVRCTRQSFTKSFLSDGAAVLARSSGEEPATPRYRAGVASMAWRRKRHEI